MIRSMVDGLAQRLHQDGHDVEGWLRLVRAYTVLQETGQGARRAGRCAQEPRAAILPPWRASISSPKNSASKDEAK